MWKVIRRGVIANKVRFLLTGIAVILGVAFISGTFVLTSTIQQSFSDLFGNIYRGTDAIVRAPQVLSAGTFGGGSQRPNIPDSVLTVVRSVPTVKDAQGNVNFNTSYAQLVDQQGKAIGGSPAPTLGLAWDPNPTINQFHLVAGHAPEVDDEIVVDKHTVDTGKFKLGERVKVLTALPPKFYTLVGIAKFGSADSLLGASITLFTLPEAQRVNNSVGHFGQISVVAKPGVSQTQVQSDIQQTLADHGIGNVQVLTGKQITKEQQDNVQKALGAFNTILLVFGFLALLVGIFIIYNTFRIVVQQRIREMALLRALGASRGQIMTQVVGESLVVGLVASAIGVAAGVLLAIGLHGVLDAVGFGLPAGSLVVPAPAVIVGMVAGTVVTVVSAVAPAFMAARIPPIAALRAFSLERPVARLLRIVLGTLLAALGVLAMCIGLFTGVSDGIRFVGLGAALIFAAAYIFGPLYARGLSNVLGAPVARLRGITGALARENASRNPKRVTVTTIPLVIGVALVGFITIFAASAEATVSHAVDTQFKSDFIVTSGVGFRSRSGFSPQLAANISKLPITQTATGIRFGFAGINGSTQQLVAADPQASAQLFDFGNYAGTFNDLTDQGIAISKNEADKHHWHLGTVLPVVFVRTSGTGAVDLPVQYIYKQNTFGDFYITLGNYDKNFTLQLDQFIAMKLKSGVSPATGRNALEALLKPYPTAKLQDNAQFKHDQVATFQGIVVFVDLLLLFTVIIALIGIANTLILSIYERTHEIGLLRAVGMGRSQVRSAIRWESVIICLIGTITGLVIGLFFGWIFIRALRDQGFSQFAIAPVQLIIIVFVLAALAFGAAILPARRASKLDILRAIAAE
jgi:putative ABC transport system permease protein